ncbi:SGNH/GDSL hydrolase family protein [Streptomyces liangshanensis]|uniref:SGNH/GDSL hydrolase family protein n=1 Tax=Streptomyces liangshanensis TaxID=2717324 RepID=A0A6G9H2F5_9ACTN|nr:SGNH/GDSL hydrolase family protein [Streptomyces liangshanensis]QIQ04644.1 SGNH/GDSL hydrolase family protein [Streptomyces liangshanensis]
MTRPRGSALLGALIGVAALVGAATVSGLGFGYGSSSGHGSGAFQGRTSVGRAAPASAGAWTGTWAAAPGGPEPGAPHGYPGRSLRNVVHTSIGGTSVRITLSNRYGTGDLRIGHASVALRGPGAGGATGGTTGAGTGAVDAAATTPGEGGAAAVPGTMRRVTFGRSPAVTVPPGGQVVSDPVRLRVPSGGDLLVTVYTPAAGGPVTYHRYALQTSYVARGDRTEDTGGRAYTGRTTNWRYLTAVDVLAADARGAVVTFGDSITDGVGSRPGANHRWPDDLAVRLRDRHIGVLNEGIGGNRLLGSGVRRGKGESGLVRFRGDVLDRAGVRAVVVDLGINDILAGRERDPGRIVGALKELTAQAHGRGLRVIGSTLTPFGGYSGYTTAGERVRQQVNAAIRAGGVFDDVVDFDRALRDPHAPDRLSPAYDSGDHLHPSDAGYRVMARTLDLGVLEARSPTQL